VPEGEGLGDTRCPSMTYGTNLQLSEEMDGPLGRGEPQRAVLFSGPAGLSMEQVTKVDLVSTIKTAKALGLTHCRFAQME